MSIIKIVDKWNWYMELIKAGAPERLLKVAFVLADNVNGQVNSDGTPVYPDVYGKAFPTVEQIVEGTGKKKSAVSLYTRELHDQGWISKEVKATRNGRKTFYVLSMGTPFETEEKVVSEKSRANLMRGPVANSDESELASPITVNSISDESESASPVVSDDKHLSKTSTETLKETSNAANAAGTNNINQTSSDSVRKEDLAYAEGVSREFFSLINFNNIPLDKVQKHIVDNKKHEISNSDESGLGLGEEMDTREMEIRKEIEKLIDAEHRAGKSQFARHRMVVDSMGVARNLEGSVQEVALKAAQSVNAVPTEAFDW